LSAPPGADSKPDDEVDIGRADVRARSSSGRLPTT
jgi:hypothetical protein